ncbi:MAG: response regulator [Candidatus Saganbacteria bacterium]|nr:response regulator [Candidatus Saganbacteria bacterium]
MAKKKYSVLTIDDSEFMLLMLQDILKNTEFEVVATATHAEEALTKFNQYHPDLVTIDVNLPHISGFELLKEIKVIIKEENLHTKCLMVSAANKKANLEEADKDGSTAFIVKPFKPETLLNQLRKNVS